jgi:hypothetical protein
MSRWEGNRGIREIKGIGELVYKISGEQKD